MTLDTLAHREFRASLDTLALKESKVHRVLLDTLVLKANKAFKVSSD